MAVPLPGLSAAADPSPSRFAIIGRSDYGFRGEDCPNINAA
jgi:hypothetical protein